MKYFNNPFRPFINYENNIHFDKCLTMAGNMTLNFCSKPYRRIFIFNSYIYNKEQMYKIFCEITTMADCLMILEMTLGRVKIIVQVRWFLLGKFLPTDHSQAQHMLEDPPQNVNVIDTRVQ